MPLKRHGTRARFHKLQKMSEGQHREEHERGCGTFFEKAVSGIRNLVQADVPPGQVSRSFTLYLTKETAMKRIYTSMILLAAVALLANVCSRAYADPLPGEVLKFQQLPLNNGIYPPSGTPTGGQPFPGHDEWSTAINGNAAMPDYRGTFAADDFADNFSTPVVHIRWWGSYDQNSNITLNSSVQKFLISFESDVPAGPAPSFSQPGTPLLTQEVSLGARAGFGNVYGNAS
jgi:hypothetical protein